MVSASLPQFVEKLKISERCLELLPCQHLCKIRLSDGQCRNVSLSAPTIHLLIQSIDREKIHTPDSLGHFDQQCRSFPKEMTAKQILEKLFPGTNIVTRTDRSYKILTKIIPVTNSIKKVDLSYKNIRLNFLGIMFYLRGCVLNAGSRLLRRPVFAMD